ncbi:hypothetical protein MUG87_18560 [Ectobacillus sp. JY-23]|uniref:hypothetical protein n=1 Tax=Ectobacillus sp. JY-23 TaxID=2933872 RepID=UPI001FF108ED|nr:hypothetical protein [Ectobacillus sp. JY-23]UOY92399.1 hypothetical protein MUG87_18560 [Ectobacillus sp. JY-23]
MRRVSFNRIKCLDAYANQIKRMYTGNQNELILVCQKAEGKPYIIQWNGSDNYRKHTQLSHVIDLQKLLFVQNIQNNWLLINHEDSDNAYILNEEGKVMHQFYVGDGIQNCQVDDENNIWISYFDEGIFSETEICWDGIIAFDCYGQIVFKEYGKFVDELGIPSIDDCYAMNVNGNEVWLYYHSEYPLVCIKNKKLYQWWPEVTIGTYHDSNGFAVGKDKVLFATNRGKLVLYSCITNKTETVIPYNELNEEITFISYVGQGSALYLQTTEGVYIIDLQ